MTNPEPVRPTRIDRRTVLGMFGASLAGSGLLAACSRGTPAGGSQNLFHAAWPYDAPPKGNFNLLTGVTGGITLGYIFDLILIPGAMYYWDSEKYYYMLADPSSSLSSDGKTFTYKVRPDLKWNDGNPVTGKDVYTTWVCQYVFANAVFEYVKSFEQTDDMTVTFHIGTPAPIAQYDLLRMRIVSDAVYGKWAKEAESFVKAKTPSTDKAVVKLNQKIASFKPDKVTVSGPFDFDYNSITNAQLSLVKNDDGYRAQNIHWDGFVIYNGETPVVSPLVLDKKVYYATHGFPVATVKQMLKEGIRILRTPVYSAYSMMYNFGRHEEFLDKRVRQALAYAIDRAQAGKIALGKSGPPDELMAGIDDAQVPTWMSPDDIAKLNHYPLDLDKATQLLEEAGWSKRGGKWYKPDGKPAAYTLIYTQQYADTTAIGQNSASQLNDFGFKITLRGEDMTQTPIDVGKGKFDLAMMGTGSSGNPYPADAFTSDLITYNYPGQAPNRGMDFPLKQKTDIVGDIDLQQATIDSGLGATPDDLKANVTKVALAFNELLPVLPIVKRFSDNPVLTSAVKGYPPDGDPIYKNSPYADNFTTFLLYDGKLRPA